MGLDTVELVVDVEKHFGISIPNVEIEAVRTVGEFAQCAAKYIAINKGQKCKSQMLFYVLRDYAFEEFQFPREQFTPSTIIGEVIPLANRKNLWDKMSNDLGLEMPPLSPRDLNPDIKYNNSLLAGLLGVGEQEDIVVRSVRDFIDWLLSLNQDKFINAGNIASLYEIERVVVYYTSEKCGIGVESIQLHHKIVDDLGLD